ncbi:MAG: MmgE/PrpD family protein [bacterium]
MKPTFIPLMADFFAGLTLEDLNGDVRERAKVCVLDAIASACAGHRTEPVRIMTAITRAFSTSADRATVWFHGYETNYLFAAVANSMMVHNMIHDDTSQSTRGHAGNLIVPAVLAAAEARESSCREILPAVVIGYEAMARIASPAVAYSVERGFRSTANYGPFGVAAAFGKMLGLTGPELSQAIACAASFSLGLLEPFNVGSMEWRFQNSMVILGGAMAALSAREGLRAAATALEGDSGFLAAFCGREVKDQIAAAWMNESSSLGRKYDLSSTFFKPYSTCGYNQIGCNIALNLIERHHITADSIREIVVRVSPDNKAYPGVEFHGPFETPDGALLSKPFMLGAAVVTRDLQVETYQERLNDPEILRVARMVRMEADPSMGSMDTEIRFVTKDGQVHTGNLSTADLGAFLLNRDTAVRKFHRMTDRHLGAERADEIVDLVFRLEELKSPGELTRRLGPEPR